jgi:hypothetical protein
MDLAWMAALTAAGLVASISNAALGIGGGLLVMPLLALWFAPRMAVGYTIPMFFASNIAISWRYRDSVKRHLLIWIIPGVLAGITAGTWFLRSAPSDLLRWVMGGLAVVFVSLEVLRLTRKQPTRGLPLWSAIPLSSAAGVASAMTNLGGTVVSLVMLGQDLEPAVFVGTLNVVMLAMSAAKMMAFYGLGLVTWHGLVLALPSIPAVLIGSKIGQQLNRRMAGLTFRWVLVGVISASAILLLAGY